MKTYRGETNRIRWTNGTGSAVSAGAVVALPNLLGLAVTDIASTATGMLETQGVHCLDATVAEAWKTGDPLWWNPATSKLTRLGAPSYRYAGTSAADKAATTDVTGLVRLNERGNIPAELLNRVWEDVTADKTLDVEDVGKVMNVTADGKVITLPATGAGLEFIIRNGGADAAVAVTVSPNANDKFMGPDLTGTDNKDRINTKATAKRGDFISLSGGHTDGYVIRAERGTWAQE